MCQASGLLAHGLDDARVAVADVQHRDPGEEVEVLVAVGIPQPAAGAAHERDRVARVGADRVVALERLQLLQRGRHQIDPIFVPWPASVNSSSSSECGTRPSTMCAEETPPWIASRHAASFGRIPPSVSAQRLGDLIGRRLGDEAAGIGRVAQPSRDVGEEHHLVGLERARDRAGGLVGVDVVRMALAVGADACDDRDVVLGDVVEHVDVDVLDPADEADVLPARRALADRPEQQPVVAAQPDGRLAVAVDQQHDVLVDLADEHHLGDLDRLRVGHAQAVDELDRQVEPLHVAGDLRAAAVDDHRVHADVLEQHDVAREVLLQRGVDHRRAAVLDHDRAAVELADVRERLEEGGDVSHVV